MVAGERPATLVAIVSFFAVMALCCFALWPVFLVELGGRWGLTNTQIGWVSGAYFIGYILATPLLVGLTDSVDAKRVFVAGALVSAFGSAGFALFADGFWSAAFFWGVTGAGLAGTYMPGLQILNARLGDARRLRAVPVYTSCFGIGTGVSFLLNGLLLVHADHRVAGWVAAGGAVAAAIAILLLVRGQPVARSDEDERRRHPLDMRPAFAKPAALGYIFSYGAHTYELFAFRGWSFALFVFVGARQELSLQTITYIVSLLTVTGMAASIIGARFCARHGRHLVISLAGMVAVAFAVTSAVLLSGPVWLAIACLWIYNICIMLDSGALTAGTVSVAGPRDRGALLAVHSVVGFAGGALGGPAVGMMLDLGGGEDRLGAWFGAVLVMGVGSAIVAIIQFRFWRRYGFAK